MWTGYYYDGRTANRETVSIAIDGDALQLTRRDGSVMTWPIASLRQSQGGHGRERLRLELGTDPVESIVVEQPGLAEAIQALAPRADPGLRTRRDHARLVSVLLTAVILLVAGYVMGAPAFARWLAPRVPPDWEQELGRAVVANLVKRRAMCTDSVTIGDVRSVVDRLLAAAPKSAYAFTLHVSSDTVVNAFAAPGGVIVVNAGLLTMAGSPEELAAVLAHEVQHVLLQHSLQAAIREVPVRLALASITGNAGVESAANVAGTLGALKYRRDDEREADRQGLALLRAARIDPSGAASFMRRLEDNRGDLPGFATYLSSHPLTAERVSALRVTSAEDGQPWTPVMSAERWERVQAGCAP